MLVGVGKKSAMKWYANRLFESLDDKNKRMNRVVWPNAYHIDLYNKEEFVDPAIAEMDILFQNA